MKQTVKVARGKIDSYQRSFLQRFSGPRKSGYEKELPVVDKTTFRALDVRPLFARLNRYGAELIENDKDVVGCNLGGVSITTDSGVGTLEFSFLPQENLHRSRRAIDWTFPLVVKELSAMGGLMLGYGIQPVTKNDNSLWKTAERTLVFRSNYPENVNGTTITASDQIHVEVTRDELTVASNVFNALAPVIITLFANSPVWLGKVDSLGRRAVREDFWKEWNLDSEERTGIPQRFGNVEEYLAYLHSLKLLAIKNGKGYYEAPGESFGQWFLKNQESQDDDQYLEYLLQQESYVWSCARPRAKYGTIEIRPACSQPPGSEMLLNAFCLGIAENLAAADQWIKSYDWEYWRQLYQKSICRGFETEGIIPVIEKALKLSRQGLEDRDYGEEFWLAGLFDRLEKRQAPAERHKKIFMEKGMEGLIRSVAY